MKTFVKRRFLPFLAVVVVLISVLVIPIGAAEIDWSVYPTSNLFDVVGFSQVNFDYRGGTATLNKDVGHITFESTSADNYVYIGNVITLKGNTQYTFSVTSKFKVRLYVFFEDGSWVRNDGGTAVSPSVTFTTPSNGVVKYFRIDNDNDYGSNMVYDIRLNKGAVAYPYQPYIPGVLRDEYEFGFKSGLGYASQVLSPLQEATAIRLSWSDNGSNSIYFEDVSFVELSQTPFWSGGYFNVSLFLKMVGSYDGDISYPTYFSMEIKWSEALSSRHFELGLEGNHGGYLSAAIYQVANGSSVSVSTFNEMWQGGDVQNYRSATFSNNVKFDSLKLEIVDPSLGSYGPQQYTDFRVCLTSSGTYAQGYSAGLKEGISIDRQEALDQYYSNGYRNGYTTGFDKGKSEGLRISDTGDFRNLILAVVEAPVNTFQSLFNFQILGMDMRVAFGSLMTLCVVLVVIKKVVL